MAPTSTETLTFLGEGCVAGRVVDAVAVAVAVAVDCVGVTVDAVELVGKVDTVEVVEEEEATEAVEEGEEEDDDDEVTSAAIFKYSSLS